MAKTFRVQPLREVNLGSVNQLVWKMNEEFDRVARAIDDVVAGRTAFTGDLDLGGNRASNAASPEADDDLVTLDALEDEVDKLLRKWTERQTSDAEEGGTTGSGTGKTSGGGGAGEDIATLLDGLQDTGVVFARTAGGTVELATDSTNLNWADTTNILTSNVLNVSSAGLVGTPSLYLAGDVDTGLWQPADNTLAISTAGVEQLRILPANQIVICDPAYANNPEIIIGGTAADGAPFGFGDVYNRTLLLLQNPGGAGSVHIKGVSYASSLYLTGYYAEGTKAAPTYPINTGEFWGLVGNGWDEATSSWKVATWIGNDPSQTWSAGNYGSYFNFQCIAKGSSTLRRVVQFMGTNIETEPGVVLETDTNTGLWHPDEDILAFSTGGAERFRFGTTEFVHNEDGDDYDFRVESDTQAYAFWVDAGLNKVGLNNVLYTWPTAFVGAGTLLVDTDGAGTLAWQTLATSGVAARPHNFLDSAEHNNVTTGTPVRGDLITGQGVTPTWTQLAVGVANQILKNDGTDVAWGKVDLADTTAEVTGTLAVGNGGTGLTSGTSGGILGYTAAGVLASSVLLTANALVLGGGAGATPTPLGSLGTTTTVLHGNAAGAPTFAAVSLTADVSGTLPYNYGGTGQSTWAQGDLLYASAANTLSKLTIGAVNTVLVSNGTIPGWSATLAGLTLTTPTISATGWTNANHSHQAANSGGQLDHQLACVAASLLDDDHTQYALLAGRTGTTNDILLSTSADGTITGSSAASGDLILQGTTADQDGLIRLQDELRLREDFPAVVGSVTKQAVSWTPTIALTGAALTTPTVYGINFSPTISQDSAGIVAYYRAMRAAGTYTKTAAGPASWSLLLAEPTLQSQTAAVFPPFGQIFVNTSTVRSYGTANVGTVGGHTTLSAAPVIRADDTSTFVMTSLMGLSVAPLANEAAGAALTITNVSGVSVSDIAVTGSPTITNQVGVNIADLTAGSTLNASLVSAGAAVQMRHAGPAVFGANAAPTNSSVGLELSSTTKSLLLSRMTKTQRDALTAVAGMTLYNSTTSRYQGYHTSWNTLSSDRICIVKSADQSVVNNSTLQDDTELQFAVLAAESWIVELLLGMSANDTTGDGKVGFTSSVASFSFANWEGVYYDGAATLTITTPTVFASTTEAVTGGTLCIAGSASPVVFPIHFRYRFTCTANATVKVQFANFSAAAGRITTMLAGSTLRATRVSSP